MCAIVSEACIILDIDEHSKEDVIYRLCKELKKENRIEENDQFYNKVIVREEMFATSIGKCIAIPHGISSSVRMPSICFGRLKDPILWDEEKNEYVKIVVLIAVPAENKQNLYLHIISTLIRHFMHDEYIEKLLASDKMTIYHVLEEGLGML